MGIEVYILIAVGVLGYLVNRGANIRTGRVNTHKENLLKGGLIPREEKSIHEEALMELGIEHPHIKLPRREFY